jgi:20S proteasome alpha/beta subunit
MTAVAGFICRGGIVLCTDTELTYGDVLKTDAKKTCEFVREGIGLSMAGAGNWDYLRMAYDKIRLRLLSTKPDITEVERAIEDVVLEIYERNIPAYPNNPKPSFSLVIGVTLPGSGADPALITCSDTAMYRNYSFEFTGTGEAFGRYFAELLYSSSMSIWQAIVLGVYILRIIKKHAPFVGKRTDISVIHNTGEVEWKSLALRTDILEGHFELLDMAFQPLFLACADGKMEQKTFQNRLDHFTKVITNLREQFKEDPIEVLRKRPIVLPAE